MNAAVMRGHRESEEGRTRRLGFNAGQQRQLGESIGIHAERHCIQACSPKRRVGIRVRCQQINLLFLEGANHIGSGLFAFPQLRVQHFHRRRRAIDHPRPRDTGNGRVGTRRRLWLLPVELSRQTFAARSIAQSTDIRPRTPANLKRTVTVSA